VDALRLCVSNILFILKCSTLVASCKKEIV
jgi:hypothetical protein